MPAAGSARVPARASGSYRASGPASGLGRSALVGSSSVRLGTYTPSLAQTLAY
jgi:hypothetical protein